MVGKLSFHVPQSQQQRGWSQNLGFFLVGVSVNFGTNFIDSEGVEFCAGLILRALEGFTLGLFLYPFSFSLPRKSLEEVGEGARDSGSQSWLYIGITWGV